MTVAEFTPTREMIDAVAEWHARQPGDRINRPLIPSLRERFGLDNAQAIAILREANLRHRRAE